MCYNQIKKLKPLETFWHKSLQKCSIKKDRSRSKCGQTHLDKNKQNDVVHWIKGW